jgi:alkaline phosphatase
LDDWLAYHNNGTTGEIVMNLPDLLNVDSANTDYLLGLFNEGHVVYHDERDEALEPSLMDMTEKAIEVILIFFKVF